MGVLHIYGELFDSSLEKEEKRRTVDLMHRNQGKKNRVEPRRVESRSNSRDRYV